MLTRVKVNLSSVVKLRNAVEDAQRYTPQFDKGIVCFDDLNQYLKNQIDVIRDSILSLERAHGQLEKKIEEIEDTLSTLEDEQEHLKFDLDEVEDKMSDVPSTIEMTDEQGESNEIPNPNYMALENEAIELRGQMEDVEEEIMEQHHQLESVQATSSEIKTSIDAMNNVVESLDEKINCFKQLKEELESVKNSNLCKCAIAISKLNKIESIIREYVNVKMVLESSLGYMQTDNFTIETLINTNINIVSKVVNELATDRMVHEDEESSIIEKIDDDGNVYRVGNDLIKNNTFKKNGYEYETDNYGRTIYVTGKLSINEQGQKNRDMTDTIEIIGKGSQLDGDDRGHLIGHQFNGSGEMENLVPQDCKINRGAYRCLETYLATKVKKGYNVQVSVIPFYSLASHRPDGIFYFYRVNGTSHIVLFPNEVVEV